MLRIDLIEKRINENYENLLNEIKIIGNRVDANHESLLNENKIIGNRVDANHESLLNKMDANHALLTDMIILHLEEVKKK